MLPPVLEVYVVWHPGDAMGRAIAEWLIDHFRGTAYSGLIGGAVEVFVRSESWIEDPDGPPRPIPALDAPPYELEVPAFTAIVLVTGGELAMATEADGGWREYVERLLAERTASPDSFALFPVRASDAALDGTRLHELVGGIQALAVDNSTLEDAGAMIRDLAQGIAQALEPDRGRVTVFVSHTNRAGVLERGQVMELVDLVRETIRGTRLGEFFDAADLQPGIDWEAAMLEAAANAALLGVRTDIYATRAWCQREVMTAKRAGMPVVMLDALIEGEERGSFLMDHVPRIPGRREADGWRRADVVRALNQLVDECLKRAIWRVQQRLAREAPEPELDVDWWASHAPEPATFTEWLATVDLDAQQEEPIVVLHPDPPLGHAENQVLIEIARLAGLRGPIEILTPRGVAQHGG